MSAQEVVWNGTIERDAVRAQQLPAPSLKRGCHAHCGPGRQRQASQARQQFVLDLLAKQPGIVWSAIRVAAGNWTTSQLTSAIGTLYKLGLIEGRGSRGLKQWYLISRKIKNSFLPFLGCPVRRIRRRSAYHEPGHS